jgi:hypothetical protein
MSERFEVPEEDLFRVTARLHPKLRLLGDININPAIENPINGLDYLSKGDSLVIAHTQLAMKTLAVNSVDNPAIITTTGTVTMPRYTRTKQGMKGTFNHSFSAVVIELDGEDFHYRVLNADDRNGFFDINGYYTKDTHQKHVTAEALITGDEHAMFIDPEGAGGNVHRQRFHRQHAQATQAGASRRAGLFLWLAPPRQEFPHQVRQV